MAKFCIPKTFSILDLEYTAWEGSRERNWSKRNEHREIIEIGIIHYNNFKEYSFLNLLVLPKINPILSQYIQTLTSIDNKLLLNQGISFTKALDLLLNFYSKNNGVIFTYGNDFEVIKENINLNKLNFDINYFNFLDIRPWIVSQLKIQNNSLDSSDLNNFLGIKNTVKHRAINDCRNIFNAIKFVQFKRR